MLLILLGTLLVLVKLEHNVSSAVHGINNAGFQLFREIEEVGENNVFSPFSVGYALHSVLVGSHGATKQQLEAFLMPPEGAPAEIQSTHETLAIDDEEIKLTIRNTMFVHHETVLSSYFTFLSKEHFNTSIHLIDFAAVEDAVSTVNSQIAKDTNGKIKELLSKDSLTEDTRLVLLNVLYFIGQWQHKFKKAFTKPKPFYVTPGSSVSTPMMHQTEHFRYLATDEFQSAALPFKYTTVEIVVYKPTGQLDVMAGELLKPGIIDQHYKAMNYEMLDLAIPKMKVSSKYKLKESLQQLGLTDMFSDLLADFSKMTSSGRKELCVEEILHQTYLSLDEEGCEAAAATAVVMRLTRSAPMNTDPVKLHLDKPFLYLLRDRTTRTVLFVGKQRTFEGNLRDKTEL